MQITNGHTKLSTELSRQLSEYHHCNVILICDNNDQLSSINSSCPYPNTIFYQCNVLKNAELLNLKEKIANDLGNGLIDILIENGKMIEKQSSENCQQFIESTSQNIMSTINVWFILNLIIYNHFIKHFFFCSY